MLTGTLPDDPTSLTQMAIPSEWCIDNSENVTISYDFSAFTGYGFATKMAATFPAGSLAKSFVPMLIAVRNAGDTAVPPFSKAGYEPLGRYIDFLPANGLTPGATFTLELPHEAVISATKFVPYQFDTAWDTVPAADIIGSGTNFQKITVRKTNPFIYAGESKGAPEGLSDKTLYFDGGYVYSSSPNAVARYSIHCKFPDLLSPIITRDSVKIYFTDLATSTPESLQVEFKKITDPLRPAHTTAGVLVRNSAFRIDSCKVFVYFSGSPRRVYKQSGGSMYTVNPGQTITLTYNEPMGYLFYVPPTSTIAISFLPSDVTFESAGFGDGRVIYNATPGDTAPYSCEYYLTDHLGSTRVVVSDKEDPVEATMYQPYGTMSAVGDITTSSINVRDKFTTKELDEEGAAMGRLEFEMVVDIDKDSLDLDDTLYSAAAIYYTDYDTTTPPYAKYDVIMFKVDDTANTAVARGTITYTADRQIKWVHVVLNATRMDTIVADVNCAITPVDVNVGPGKLVKISSSINAKAQLPMIPAVGSKSVLSIAAPVVYAAGGIGEFYFGARYFDPEVGVWGSTDPIEQDWNVYGYCGGNPINAIDPAGAAWGQWALGVGADILTGGAFSVTGGAALATGGVTAGATLSAGVATASIPWLNDKSYELQQKLLPVAFKVNGGMGSNGINFGFDASLQVIPSFYSVHVGATYYTGNWDNSLSGWETRNGTAWSVGPLTYSGTHFSGGGLEQTTNSLSWDLPAPGFKLNYENDGAMPEFLYHTLTPKGDGDRWRTAAGRIDMGPMQIGLNMFTGDPGEPGNEKNIDFGKDFGPNGTYHSRNGMTPDKYRAGALWLGFGGFRAGRNSERIRNFFQNEMVHDNPGVKAPHFKVLDKDEGYWYLGSGSGNTLW